MTDESSTKLCLATTSSTTPTHPAAIISDAGINLKREEELRDWAQLIGDGVRAIADALLVDDVTEYIRLRAVCRPWRAATADPSLLQPRFLPRNWEMLRNDEFEGEEPVDEAEPYRFVNMLTGATIHVQLPTDAEYGDVLTHAAEGLLLFYCNRTDMVRVYNPLTMATAAVLPGFIEFEVLGGQMEFTAAGFVVDAEAPDHPTVVLVAMVAGYGHCVILCAKHGDEHWSIVDTSVVEAEDWDARPFEGGLSLRGRFYVPTRYGDVLTVELQPQRHLVYVARPGGPRYIDAWACYLVPSLDAGGGDNNNDNDGVLMVRVSDIFVSHVFAVHIGQGRLTELEDIGNRTVFLPAVTLRTDRFPSLVEGPGLVHNGHDLEDYIVVG